MSTTHASMPGVNVHLHFAALCSTLEARERCPERRKEVSCLAPCADEKPLLVSVCFRLNVSLTASRFLRFHGVGWDEFSVRLV